MIKKAPRAFLSFDVELHVEGDYFVISDKTPGSRLRIKVTKLELEEIIPRYRGKLQINWQAVVDRLRPKIFKREKL